MASMQSRRCEPEHGAHVFAPPLDPAQPCKCGARRLNDHRNGKVTDLDAHRPHIVVETGPEGDKCVHVIPVSDLLAYARGADTLPDEVVRRIVVEWFHLICEARNG